MSVDEAERASLRREIGRRRTFAIISHPDAGKTTLTEKLLLYSGLLRTAGMVGGRKGRGASSDWMGMEQERGISITASAMQFTYRGNVVNVLDTPGHQDFSEDTYRTLTAADSVIMVIDAAKGVEPQTRKLFAACRLREIPVLTFVNKMDMPAREPLDLMAEVEEVLGIQATAMNWPIGSGREFQGVLDRRDETCLLYTKTGVAGSTIPDCERVPLAAAATHPRLGPQASGELHLSLELLREAGNAYLEAAFLAGEITPVFFGSALTNFGVEPLFESFIDLAPPPRPRPATDAKGQAVVVQPDEPFTAFVFKLQANMNRKHRDCVAFMRINSGRYERELAVKLQRTGKKFAMPAPHSLVVNERSTLQEAYPGDIIGVINKGQFRIGDTITCKNDVVYAELSKFQPEHFAYVRPRDLGKQKPFQKGLEQLVSEGTVQLLQEWNNSGGRPIVGVVGKLQFEVMQYRFEDEYGVVVDYEPMPYLCSAWVEGDLDSFQPPVSARLVADRDGRPMVLFVSDWDKQYCQRQNPEHRLLDYA